MNAAEIYEMMTNIGYFALATEEGDQPRVRNMMLYKADSDGIVFHTGTFKEIYGQIAKNPKAELCFYDPAKGLQIRVSGALEMLDDNALKEEISSHPSRVFLQGWKNSVSREEFYQNFIVFRLKGGKAVVWTMETNMAPKAEIAL